jgi:hypothetical protein
MTLEDLIRALTGREEPQRAPYIRERPTSELPRYPGQGMTPGALRRDPIPQWATDLQGPAQERMSVMRGQEGGLRRPVGPGGVTGDEPPLRVPFRALQGPRPSMGTAADWIQGPPRGVSSAPYISDGPRDTAPWRQPEQDPITNDLGQELELETIVDPNAPGRIAGYRETGNRRQNTAHFGAGGEAPLGFAPVQAPKRTESWPSDWSTLAAEDPAFTAALRRVEERERQRRERAIMDMSPIERASGLRPRRY